RARWQAPNTYRGPPSRRFRRQREQTPHQRQRGFGGRAGENDGHRAPQQGDRVVRQYDDMGGVAGFHQRHQALDRRIGHGQSPRRLRTAQDSPRRQQVPQQWRIVGGQFALAIAPGAFEHRVARQFRDQLVAGAGL